MHSGVKDHEAELFQTFVLFASFVVKGITSLSCITAITVLFRALGRAVDNCQLSIW